MMRRTFDILWLGIIMLCASSCTISPGGDVATEPMDVGMGKILEPSAVVGTWRGVIPCADCPGINYNLSLSTDSRFEETMIYQDRDVQPYTRTGTWHINSGLLELESPDSGVPTRFKLEPTGELNMLGQDGNPVDTALAPMYRLKREVAYAEDNPALWSRKGDLRIDFVATGNEPSWSLEIDLEGSMNFKTLPSQSIIMHTPVPDPVTKGNKTTYRATTETGELKVEIIKQPCEDTMLGKVSPYLVRVTAKGISFKGCGAYLGE